MPITEWNLNIDVMIHARVWDAMIERLVLKGSEGIIKGLICSLKIAINRELGAHFVKLIMTIMSNHLLKTIQAGWRIYALVTY